MTQTKPQYQQVSDDLRSRISAPSPEWAVGEKLPTIEQLMEHYEVPSLNTIRHALTLLADDGLIKTLRSKGSYVVRIPAETSVESKTTEEVRRSITRAIAALNDALAALPGAVSR